MPAKKTTSSKTKAKAAKKAPISKATPTKSAKTKKTTAKGGKTKVTVKFDAGFGNALYVRGCGCTNLSWEKGKKLKNTKEDEWIFETTSPVKNGEFKILINDSIYEDGDNHTLCQGENVMCIPYFSKW